MKRKKQKENWRRIEEYTGPEKKLLLGFDAKTALMRYVYWLNEKSRWIWFGDSHELLPAPTHFTEKWGHNPDFPEGTVP